MLRDKIAIITGATRGIGSYAAYTLASHGAKLALAGRDEARLQNVADESRRSGTAVLALKTDVRVEEDVRRMVDRTMDRFGRIDILINNAAVVTHFGMGSPLWPRIRDMDEAFWETVMRTNLDGTFLCTKYTLPHMEAQRAGHIINLYGNANIKRMGGCAYAVSKEAIRTFTRYLAEEEREWNVCVMALTPGRAIVTEDASEEARRRLPGVEAMGSAFVEAAEAPMEWTGRLFSAKSGRLELMT